MADLLLGRLGLTPAPRRKERTFRLPEDFSLCDFTGEELRSWFCFGRESIKVLTELLHDNLERDTSRNHALSKSNHAPNNQPSLAHPCTETRKLHRVAIDQRGETSKQTQFFLPREGFPGWLPVLATLTLRFRYHMKTKTILSIVKGSIPLICKQFSITKVGKMLKYHS